MLRKDARIYARLRSNVEEGIHVGGKPLVAS
jgi:hypothetical protein